VTAIETTSPSDPRLRDIPAVPGSAVRVAPGVEEERARRELRAQVARLERELCDRFVSAFPRSGIDVRVPARGGPRLLDLAELECLRDRLASRVQAARGALAARGRQEKRNRVLLERMLLDPGRYRFTQIANADLGEGGCGVWRVKPRLGLIGMLAGWWHVKLSSGCPLAGGGRPLAASRCQARPAAGAQPPGRPLADRRGRRGPSQPQALS